MLTADCCRLLVVKDRFRRAAAPALWPSSNYSVPNTGFRKKGAPSRSARCADVRIMRPIPRECKHEKVQSNECGRLWFSVDVCKTRSAVIGYATILWIPALLYSACLWGVLQLFQLRPDRLRG